jgi:hypothetical protein
MVSPLWVLFCAAVFMWVCTYSIVGVVCVTVFHLCMYVYFCTYVYFCGLVCVCMYISVRMYISVD